MARSIAKPVTGSVRVALAGVEQMSGWSVDTTTGLVTFAQAPGAGVAITAGLLTHSLTVLAASTIF